MCHRDLILQIHCTIKFFWMSACCIIFMTLHWTILLSIAKGLGTSKVYSTTMFVAITVHNMVVYTYIPGHITWLGQINQTEHLRSSKLQCKFWKRNKQCYIGLCIFFSGSSCDIQNLTFILKRISINTLMRQKICSYNEYGKEKQQFFWNEISQKSYEKESYNLWIWKIQFDWTIF